MLKQLLAILLSPHTPYLIAHQNANNILTFWYQNGVYSSLQYTNATHTIIIYVTFQVTPQNLPFIIGKLFEAALHIATYGTSSDRETKRVYKHLTIGEVNVNVISSEIQSMVFVLV